MERSARVGASLRLRGHASAEVCSHTHSRRRLNSSFHGSPEFGTYSKWASATPTQFRFAVKLPRTITHDQQLRRVKLPLERFLWESSGLKGKRGPLLIPPSFEFERRGVKRFLDALRTRYDGPLVCEPRHETWFSPVAHTSQVRGVE